MKLEIKLYKMIPLSHVLTCTLNLMQIVNFLPDSMIKETISNFLGVAIWQFIHVTI